MLCPVVSRTTSSLVLILNISSVLHDAVSNAYHIIVAMSTTHLRTSNERCVDEAQAVKSCVDVAQTRPIGVECVKHARRHNACKSSMCYKHRA
jgi:hypothetical protein